ncbi:WD40/YVTN/BNR-like repeat-containing protein [bacterium]
MLSKMNIFLKVISVLLLTLMMIGCGKKDENNNPVGPDTNIKVRWEPTGIIPYETNYTRIYALAILSNNTVFAGGDCGVYRSANRGGTWTEINAGLSEPPVYPNIRSLAMNGNGHLIAGASQIYKSTNQGDQWSVKNGDDYLDRINTIAYTSDQELFISAGWSGVYRSTDDGETWSPVNNGLDDLSVEAMVINPDNDVIYIGAADYEGNHIYRSENNGEAWVKIGSLETNIVTLAINASGHLFAGTGDGMFRSKDNGETWSAINDGFSWEPWVLSMLIIQDGSIFIGTTDGAFVSTDHGDTWKDVSVGFTEHVTAVLSLAIDSDGYLYAGTRFSGVFRSQSKVN